MSFNTFELLTLKELPKESNVSQESNHSKVMIVLSVNEDKDLRSNLLTKIMKAVNVDLVKESIIVDAPHHGINVIKLISEQNIDKVIVFGVRPADLSLNVNGSLYKLIKINSIEFLFSDNLTTISTNQERKKALWAKLQILFPN